MYKTVVINVLIFIVLVKIVDLGISFKTEGILGASRIISLREFPPNSNFTVQPSEVVMSRTQNLKSKDYKIVTDNDGFIISENLLDSSYDSVDIIFFGGSTTECLYVEENQRFPILINELMSHKNTGKPVISLNGGKSGNHSLHSTLNLLAKGIKHRPKYVVLMHNINDLVALLLTGSYWNSAESRSVILKIPEGLSPLRSFFSSIKNLWCPNIYLALFNEIKKHQPIPDEWKKFRDSIPNLKWIQVEKSFAQSVKSFIQTAKINEIEVILMTQFNRFNPNDEFIKEIFLKDKGKNFIDFETFCNHYQRFNEKIREIAVEEEVLLIDLDKAVPKDSMHLFDYVHLNTYGSVQVAKIIANNFIENNSNYTFTNQE